MYFYKYILWKCDKIKKKKVNCDQKLKTEIAIKVEQNCDKTQQLKLWQLKNSLGQNSKPQIMTELKNSNCDIGPRLKLWQLNVTKF